MLRHKVQITFGETILTLNLLPHVTIEMLIERVNSGFWRLSIPDDVAFEKRAQLLTARDDAIILTVGEPNESDSN